MPIMIGRSPYSNQRSPFSGRMIIAAVIAVVSIIGYFSRSSFNPVTGRTQHVTLSPDQEVALGLQSAPEMARQFGGVSSDERATALVQRIGGQIVSSLPREAHQYPFEYHLLADRQTVNAFALPGGQVFITEALLRRLETEGQLAGVLGHETGHVLARHSAEQMAKAQLTQGLVGAATVAASDRRSGGYAAAAVAQFVGQFVMLRYSREDELEADKLGVRLMARAGYDPKSMIGVMKVLERATGDSGRAPDFMSTHPNPENRIGHIEEAIRAEFPQGVPAGLKP